MCESMEELAREAEKAERISIITNMIKNFRQKNPEATQDDVVSFVSDYTGISVDEVVSCM